MTASTYAMSQWRRATLTTDIDYEKALDLLQRGRPKGERKKLARNTYLVGIVGIDGETSCVNLTLHGHAIAKLAPGNRVVLDSCGWTTMTTKDRLNYLRGLSVYTLHGVWYVSTKLHYGPEGFGRMNRPLFYDGMVIDQDSGEIPSGVRYWTPKRRVDPQGHQAGVWTPPDWEAGRIVRLAPSL